MSGGPVEHSLEGWDIVRVDQADWVPWGGSGANARAKVLGGADGFMLVLVEAEAGYHGDPHEHAHPELLYVIDGSLRTQGQTLVRGDGYAAASGSTHTDFATDSGATYLLVFKL
jgi:quercetin dioxygenase-like cupin family protein